MKNKITAVKNHVVHHRAKYAVAVTLTGALALQLKGAQQWNEFLKEHDLFDEFYQYNEV